MSISNIITILLLIIAIIFVPIIPNDTPIECNGASVETCDEGVGYISVYYKITH
jgi:hypothetical protein